MVTAAAQGEPSLASVDDLAPGELLARIQETLDALRRKSSLGPPSHIVHIRNFRSETYRLRDDLIVSLGREEGQWVATSYDTGQYGTGVSPEDAIEHLLLVLEDYYEILQEESGNLGRQLKGHLRYLDSILVRTR